MGDQRVSRHQARWVGAGMLAVVVALVLGVSIGAVGIPPGRTLLELLDRLPFVHIDSGLSDRQAAIVWDLRMPRVLVALLVGSMLAVAGASYQGVFRNPLADPYLLGAAAGAGLGATLLIVAGARASGGLLDPVPLAAFVGALGAVAAAYALGAAGQGGRATATLVLAGVAVASFLTAAQTFIQQRNAESIREIYSWILGRLGTATWHEVALLVPYWLVTMAVLVVHGRSLDVLAVGDAEATSLGLATSRVRVIIVVAASLATAAAVAATGLIGFVGIVVPHAIRLGAGSSFRRLLPLCVLFGGAFLVLADLVARTAAAPSEIPIGVVTAFVGAPFFIIVLRTTRVSIR